MKTWQTTVAGAFAGVFLVGFAAVFGNNLRNMLGLSTDTPRSAQKHASSVQEASFEQTSLKPSGEDSADRAPAELDALKKMERTSPEVEPDMEIETALKRVLQLRRDGKTEEAQTLLQQLQERSPNDNLEERLRRLENKENT